jgi:hypothetical protein
LARLQGNLEKAKVCYEEFLSLNKELDIGENYVNNRIVAH